MKCILFSSLAVVSVEGLIPELRGLPISKTMLIPLPGDYGFDPFQFSDKDLFSFGALNKNRNANAILLDYSDAEIRHGRLAMIAALAWPVQEAVSPAIARIINREAGWPGLSDVLAETFGRNPTLLNGGLEQSSIPFFMIVVAGLISAIDLKSLQIREADGDAFTPGDFGFDPLNMLGGASAEAVSEMREKEVNNGRLAMLAVVAYVIEEAVSKIPITQLTPAFFNPPFFFPSVLSQLDSWFSVASAAQSIPSESVNSFFANAQI